MVPAGGFEPPRPFGQGILSPLRLPIPPRRHGLLQNQCPVFAPDTKNFNIYSHTRRTDSRTHTRKSPPAPVGRSPPHGGMPSLLRAFFIIKRHDLASQCRGAHLWPPHPAKVCPRSFLLIFINLQNPASQCRGVRRGGLRGPIPPPGGIHPCHSTPCAKPRPRVRLRILGYPYGQKL